jgi:hypothetical protein
MEEYTLLGETQQRLRSSAICRAIRHAICQLIHPLAL